MDVARGLIVKLPHGLVAMRISALASSTIARASTKRKGEGAHGGRSALCGSSARCSCTYAWQESCQTRASIRRHTRRTIHGDVPPVVPGNPHLLPSVTFPLYDCTLDPPRSAPANALWGARSARAPSVCANGPQASRPPCGRLERDRAPKDACHLHRPRRPSLALEGSTRMLVPSSVLWYAGEQDTITQKPCDGMGRNDTCPRAVACASRFIPLREDGFLLPSSRESQ